VGNHQLLTSPLSLTSLDLRKVASNLKRKMSKHFLDPAMTSSIKDPNVVPSGIAVGVCPRLTDPVEWLIKSPPTLAVVGFLA
jgi:hypothetical protein